MKVHMVVEKVTHMRQDEVRVGAKVRIKSGPLAGSTGIIIYIDEEDDDNSERVLEVELSGSPLSPYREGDVISFERFELEAIY